MQSVPRSRLLSPHSIPRGSCRRSRDGLGDRALSDTSRAEIEQALVLAPRLATARRELEALFPVGLDLDGFCRKLRTKDAIDALRANLPDGYQAPAVFTALDTLAGASDLPLFRTIREFRARLGTDDIGHQDIVALRGELTREIHRLAALKPDLAKLGEDLRGARFGRCARLGCAA